jgi:hypothetical protein
MERGGEGPAAPARQFLGGDAERPFRGDMQRIRTERLDHARQAAARQNRQPDIGIGGARQGTKPVRPDDFGDDAEGRQLIDQLVQGADHAVHLRAPRIRNDQDARLRREAATFRRYRQSPVTQAGPP